MTGAFFVPKSIAFEAQRSWRPSRHFLSVEVGNLCGAAGQLRTQFHEVLPA